MYHLFLIFLVFYSVQLLSGEDLLWTINLGIYFNQSCIKLKEISKLRINLTETFYDTETTKFNQAQILNFKFSIELEHKQLKTKSLFLF